MSHRLFTTVDVTNPEAPTPQLHVNGLTLSMSHAEMLGLMKDLSWAAQECTKTRDLSRKRNEMAQAYCDAYERAYL